MADTPINPASENQSVALITGTSSGIGRAAALALKAAGFMTVATARRVADIEELKAKGCDTVQLDVTDEASMQNAVKTVESAHGRLDVLVNNAGYGQYGPVEEVPMDAVRRQFEVNVFGLVRMCQLVLPGMRRAGRGRIINVSSVAGEITQPGAGFYHATKHAVEAINETLRMERAPSASMWWTSSQDPSRPGSPKRRSAPFPTRERTVPTECSNRTLPRPRGKCSGSAGRGC